MHTISSTLPDGTMPVGARVQIASYARTPACAIPEIPTPRRPAAPASLLRDAGGGRVGEPVQRGNQVDLGSAGCLRRAAARACCRYLQNDVDASVRCSSCGTAAFAMIRRPPAKGYDACSSTACALSTPSDHLHLALLLAIESPARCACATTSSHTSDLHARPDALRSSLLHRSGGAARPLMALLMLIFPINKLMRPGCCSTDAQPGRPNPLPTSATSPPGLRPDAAKSRGLRPWPTPEVGSPRSSLSVIRSGNRRQGVAHSKPVHVILAHDPGAGSAFRTNGRRLGTTCHREDGQAAGASTSPARLDARVPLRRVQRQVPLLPQYQRPRKNMPVVARRDLIKHKSIPLTTSPSPNGVSETRRRRRT